MVKMSPTEFFRRINAPLVAPRWSWGARRTTGSLVFRCWSSIPAEFSWSRREAYIGETPAIVAARPKVKRSPGAPERDRMVADFLAGATSFIVFGEHVSPIVNNRIRTKHLHMESLYPVIGHRIDENGGVWAKFGDPIPSREFMQ